MADMQRSTVVGVFDRRDQAECALDGLRRLGLSDKQIGMAMRNEEGMAPGTQQGEGNKAGEGLVTGAVTGGILGGILAAAASLLIPGVGPVLAGGVLAAALGGAAVGATAGGLLGVLIGLGVPEEEARYYDQEFKSGHIIVTAQADGQYDRAWSVMQQCGGYNMQTRGQRMTGAATTGSTTGNMNAEERTIPIREEKLQARKQPTQTGSVDIHKEVVTENKTINVPVTHEEVVVERHPVEGGSREARHEIGEGEEIHIPVTEEQVQVDKRTVVTGEVDVHKQKVQENKQVSGEVRREEVKVDRKGNVDVRNQTDQNKDKKV